MRFTYRDFLGWILAALLAALAVPTLLTIGFGFGATFNLPSACTAVVGATITASNWNTCLTAVAAAINAIDNAKVSASAGIVGSKLDLTTGTGAATFGGTVTANSNTVLGQNSSQTITVNGTVTSNLIFTDNTYDIGASGATRPRHVYLSGTLTAGSTPVTVTTAAGYLDASKLAIGSQAIGDVLYASSTSAWSRLGTGTSGQLLTAGGAGNPPSWTTVSVKQMLAFGTGTGPNNSTLYYGLGLAPNATEATAVYEVPFSGTLKNLRVRGAVAVVGNTTAVVRKNAATTAITCVVSATGTTCQDTSNTVSITAGDTLAVSVQSGSDESANAIKITLELDPS